MREILKQKFLIICSSLILIFSLLVSNLNAFSSEFASNSSSFSSSSSSQNDRDPTCIIADKIALEMEGWPMNYYKNPELDARYLLYEKASNTCYKAESITSKLEKLQSTKVQITCTNINSLREQAKNNYDAKIAEEYYNAIKACSDDIGSNLAFSTSSSKQYSQQEIQTACEMTKDYFKDQSANSYQQSVSVSEEFYTNQQICNSNESNLLTPDSLTSSFYNGNTSSSSSYSYNTTSRKPIQLCGSNTLSCTQDVNCSTKVTLNSNGCNKIYDECDSVSFCGTISLQNAFCSTSPNNQIAQYINCFIVGISFIAITLSVAYLPVSVTYILALYLNKSKKWKDGFWLISIPTLIIVGAIILLFITTFIYYNFYI